MPVSIVSAYYVNCVVEGRKEQAQLVKQPEQVCQSRFLWATLYYIPASDHLSDSW